MKVGLFWGWPSLPLEQMIDGGAVLSLIHRARSAMFFQGEGGFPDNIMLSAGHPSRQLFLTHWHFLPTHWHFLVIWFSCGRCNAQRMAKRKNRAAVELGRKGGKTSAERLTNEQRKEKARKAAQARWTKRQK
jgi:hypothetical protein